MKQQQPSAVPTGTMTTPTMMTAASILEAMHVDRKGDSPKNAIVSRVVEMQSLAHAA